MYFKKRCAVMFLATLWGIAAAYGGSVNTAFTYQGQLKQGGIPVNERCDFEFSVWDNETDSHPSGQVGLTVSFVGPDAVVVANGLFTVQLDFGQGVFEGEERFLEIAALCPPALDFTILSPRQLVTSTPHSMYALRTTWYGLMYVPPDIADGDDDTTLSEGQVEDYLTNESINLATGTTLDGVPVSTGPHTTDTNAALVCSGDSVFLDGNGNCVTVDTSGDAHSLDAVDGSPVDAVYVDSEGNVGIGNVTPSAKLDVAGIVRSSLGGFEFPDGTVQTTAGAANGGWSLTGNSGTTAGTDFLGTTDNVPLQLHVNGVRALRLEPNADSPSLVGGWNQNNVTSGVAGAVVGGGGAPLISGNPRPNIVTDDYGTVSGGSGNRAGNGDSTLDNTNHATVGGGYANDASGPNSTVAGGWYNRATQARATVGGGWNNLASRDSAVVAGGRDNQATGDQTTVSGGAGNHATGANAMIPGGLNNSAQGVCSLAAGRRAHAAHAGAFVWADYNDEDFNSTALNQFLIRAAGGVGIGTPNPTSMLTVAGLIQSTTGGIKFPDDTVQTTAAVGGESLWHEGGGGIYYNAGRVGVGTSNPAVKLEVNGPARIQGAAWPGSGEGMELAYSSGTKKGYIQVFDRNTDTWGNLYLGNGNVGIGIGIGNSTAKLAVSGVIESTSGGIKYPDGTQQTTAAVACWDLNGNGIGDGAEDTNGDGSVDVLDCQGPPGPATTTSALCAGRAQYPPAGACDAICTGLVVAEMRELQCSATADTGSCSSPPNFSYGLCCVCAP